MRPSRNSMAEKLLAAGRITPEQAAPRVTVLDLPEPKVDAKKKRKPAHVKGQMNETEKRYAHRLTELVRAGLVESFTFEGEVLQLAHRTTYSPDFLVILPGARRVHVEVKGAFVFDEAKVKFKVSSRLFQEDLFIWAQWKRGVWTETAWYHGAPLKGFTWEKSR